MKRQPTEWENIFTNDTSEKELISKIYKELALAGVAQWIECRTANQRVAGSIPNQGTSLDYRPGPQLGVHKRQPHIDVSLPPCLPPFPLFKNK